MIIPTEARRDLYEQQAQCGVRGIAYADYIWQQRYTDSPKPTGAWPFCRVESNIHPMRKRRGHE